MGGALIAYGIAALLTYGGILCRRSAHRETTRASKVAAGCLTALLFVLAGFAVLIGLAIQNCAEMDAAGRVCFA